MIGYSGEECAGAAGNEHDGDVRVLREDVVGELVEEVTAYAAGAFTREKGFSIAIGSQE